MNAKTMYARENFIEVLLSTIKTYYQEVHGAEVELSLEKKKGFKTLYLYNVPLFLSGFPISKGAKKFLYSEYNIRGNMLKYVIGKLGVFAITNSFGIGAAQKIYMYAEETVNTNLFISPCNRTIRFYNFDTDTVDCIVKVGYRSLFFDNQLRFRTSCSYTFVPVVLKGGSGWYTEKIMHGHALARVRDQRHYGQSIAAAERHIATLAADTLQYIPIQEYFAHLCGEFAELCGLLLDQQDGLRQRISVCIEDMMRRMRPIELTVPTCMSHGDFQKGNIWVTDDKQVLIYDWEACDRRSVWYDLVTLYFPLRSEEGTLNLQAWLCEDGRWLGNDPCKQYTSAQMACINDILCLEDVVFQMREAQQLSTDYCQKRAREVLGAFVKVAGRYTNESET